MTRMLLRSGKDPFTPVTAEATLDQDVFNSNSGNYLFQHAIWKSLQTPDTEIVSNGTLSEREPPGPDDANRINDEFDHFVIPLANAFRPEFSKRLEKLTSLIEGLNIPVTVIGVGAQAGVELKTEALDEMSDVVRAFVGAVLDRSASIGVRGDFTKNYLTGLGFADDAVDVIGCPSLFLHGPDLRIDKDRAGINAQSKVALNLTPEVPGIGAFATQQAAAHPNLTYIGQDANDLRLMLWGVPFPHVTDQLAPVHSKHPLYLEDRMRLFLDGWTWFDFLASCDFTYGTRFHGNVAALLARRPAMLLAHDSRTLELAEYHQMPHRVVPEFADPIDAVALYDEADFSQFNAELPRGFERYRSFLERNELANIWQPGHENPQFAVRVSQTAFPPAVKTLCAPGAAELVSRLQWMYDSQIFDSTLHQNAYQHPFAHPPRRDPATRLYKIEQSTKDKLAANRAELNELRNRLQKLENRTVKRFVQRGFGRLKRSVQPKPKELPEGKSDG